MTIRTERLILRPFFKNDIEWYYEMVEDKEFRKRLPGLAADGVEEAKWNMKIFTKCDFTNDFYYVITDKECNAMGIIVAVRVTKMIIDVSYFLNKEYRHNGYMQEALKKFITEARSCNPMYRFRMIVAPDNIASLKVLRSCNAQIEVRPEKYVCYL